MIPVLGEAIAGSPGEVEVGVDVDVVLIALDVRGEMRDGDEGTRGGASDFAKCGFR